jgi:ribonuclease HI
MSRFALFTDVSLDPQRKFGIGAYLLVPATFLETEPRDIRREQISAQLRLKKFTETSSTKLEVQTVLWALDNYQTELNGSAPGNLRVYTDSQCIAGLPGRRADLEANDFVSRQSRRPLTNAHLYREFYIAYDKLRFELIKIAGHSRSISHNSVQRIFSYVDKEARRALSLWKEELC